MKNYGNKMIRDKNQKVKLSQNGKNNENQHETNYIRYQMVNENNTRTEDDKDKMNYNETESVETIDNQSIRTVDQYGRYKEFESKTYTVQVLHNIIVEKFNDENKILFRNLAMSSAKFVRKWFRQGLIKGVINNSKDQVIEDFSSYNEGINNF